MNPYKVLGVPVGSNEVTCKSAYRKLSMIHHPDRGGDVNKFMQIKNAFEFLKKKGFPQVAHSRPVNVYTGNTGNTRNTGNVGVGAERVLTHLTLFNFGIR